MKRLTMGQYATMFWGERERRGDTDAALAVVVEHALATGIAIGSQSRGKPRKPETRRPPRSVPKHMLPKRAAVMAIARPYRLAVAFRCGIKPAALGEIRRSRASGVLCPLHELAWLLKTVEQLSYPLIALACEWADHTVALNAVRRAEAAIAERPALRYELLALVPSGRVGMERAA